MALEHNIKRINRGGWNYTTQNIYAIILHTVWCFGKLIESLIGNGSFLRVMERECCDRCCPFTSNLDRTQLSLGVNRDELLKVDIIMPNVACY